MPLPIPAASYQRTKREVEVKPEGVNHKARLDHSQRAGRFPPWSIEPAQDRRGEFRRLEGVECCYSTAAVQDSAP